jgi:hypothetical protein
MKILIGTIHKKYYKNTKLDFGIYKGVELGIVYAFDPGYVDWCINNIYSFYVVDLEELIKYGVINQELDWQYKNIGEKDLIPNIDAFDTFEELLNTMELDKRILFFEKETIEKNRKKGQ